MMRLTPRNSSSLLSPTMSTEVHGDPGTQTGWCMSPVFNATCFYVLSLKVNMAAYIAAKAICYANF